MQEQDIKYCKKLIKKARPEWSREDRHDLLQKLIKQPRLKELLERNKLKDDVKETESKEMEGLAESLTYSTIMGQNPLVLGFGSSNFLRENMARQLLEKIPTF